MKITIENEPELRRESLAALMKLLPLSKVVRLLSLWRIGRDDYTLERHSLLA
jgi:hypothetical protein